MTRWRSPVDSLHLQAIYPASHGMTPPRSDETIDLGKFLPYRLSVLTNLVSSTIAAAYQQRFGLSIPEWRVLAVLAPHPGISATEVAELTRMDAVAVSRAVARLAAAGRLRRTTSRDDRRRSVLSASTAGMAVYREVAPLALGYESELLAALTAGERAALDRALDALTSRAQSLAGTQRKAIASPSRATTARRRRSR
jgi:DNA-binding MarR family transcriptional regulator